MPDVWTQVEEAVLAGHADRLVDLCLPLDEAARTELAPAAEELQQRVDRAWQSPVQRTAQTALLCLGPPPRDRSVVRHPAYERLEAVVRSRPRAWRDQWASGLARFGYVEPIATWQVLRSVLRSGDCAKPEGENYPWLLLYAMQCLADGVWCEPGSVTDALRDDPQLLDEDLWVAFRIAAANRRLRPGWGRAMAELAAEGAIPRPRLVDETVAALRREEEPGTARSLVAFHDRVVKPTPAELATHQAVYLRWLESDRDAMTGFALSHLTRLNRAIPLDGRELLDRLGPLVAMRAKAHAKRAVSLAGQVVDREPALIAEGLGIVIGGLAHESAEVQLAALDVLERHAEHVDREQVASFAGVLDPALKARVEHLAAIDTAPHIAVVAVPVPGASVVDASRVPRLLPDARLVPVEGIDELLDLASRLLEGLGDADEAERFADGLSRLCELPVPAGRRTAILRRARRRSDPIATLTRAWLGWDGEHLPVAVPNRLGAALEHVADLDALHAVEVQAVIEATLGAFGDHRPTMASTLDLLRRLAQEADARVSDPAARAWLEALGTNSKSGRLARAALDVTGDGAARSVEAVVAVAEADRDRARRWGPAEQCSQ